MPKRRRNHPSDTVPLKLTPTERKRLLEDLMCLDQDLEQVVQDTPTGNPRRVAVILDKQAKKGAVLPLDLLEQVIEGAVKAKLENWLSDPQSPFYVMHIAGSWFGTRKEGS